MGLGRSAAAPLGFEPSRVPRHCQCPGSGQGEYGSHRAITGSAPAVDVILRPEEQDCGSCKADIVPPRCRGNREVYHTRGIGECTPCRPHGEWVAAIGAAGTYLRLYLEHGRNAKGIPGTVRPPSSVARRHPKFRRSGRKRHSHPELASSGVHHQNMVGVEPLQAGADHGWVDTKVSAGLGKRRRLAGAHKMSIDRQPHLAVQIVSRHS